jgi:hypothetical protein
MATPKDMDVEDDEAPPYPKPARRGRKAADPNDSGSKKTSSGSKGRQTPKPQMESEPDLVPASKPRKGRANSSVAEDKVQAPRVTRAKPVELDHDPLDSFGQSEPAAIVPERPRAKSKSRSRTNTAEVIKEEAETDVPRSSRSKKTPTATKSKAPASADNSVPQVRSTRKAAPVSISDSAPSEGNGDKENAPKLADEDDAVKPTTRAGRGTAKAKEVKEEPEVVERRRTRTRTGGRK